MSGQPIQRRVYVSGTVQGVGFRATIARMAMKYPGLKGYVRNLEDGRVEAVFAGPLQSVLEMVACCKQGPTWARVEALEVIEEGVDPSLSDFAVRRDAG